jgi:hypothetical protein
MGVYQSVNPAIVFNGDIQPYTVNAAPHPDGSFTQLMGIDDGYLDAFSRLRVSTPQPLIEVMFTNDLVPLYVEANVATNATIAHSANLASAILTVSTDDNSKAILQTRQHAPYAPGKSQLAIITFDFGDPVENVSRRAGYWDGSDGIYFEQTLAGVSLNLDTSIVGGSDQTAAQADWNFDKLDGTGPSGVTADFTIGQILVIDLQFLGVGRVRCGFDIGGIVFWCHQFNNANSLAVQPYMRKASLPLRWEIENTAASAGATLQAICGQVMSEGGVAEGIGHTFSIANVANVATSTSSATVLAIRPKTEWPASSGRNPHATIIPGDLSVSSVGAAILVEVFYNPTFSGGAWASADANSAVEFSVNSTVSADGTEVAAFFVPSGGTGLAAGIGNRTIASQYPLTVNIDGTTQRGLLVKATTLTGTGTVRAALAWREIR